MKRIHRLVRLLKQAQDSEPERKEPIEAVEILSRHNNISFEEYMRQNPLPGDIPRNYRGTKELEGLFDDETLNAGTYERSKNLTGVPDELRYLFTDEQLRLTPEEIKPEVKPDSSTNIAEESEGEQERAGEEAEAGAKASKVSGSGKVSAQQLFNDLKAGIANKNLCIAMVANAIGESGLYYNANGDCRMKSAKTRGIDTSKYKEVFKSPRRGSCCSFGLWQYQICSGLGVHLLNHYGVKKASSDAEKIAILTSYDKQVEFMVKHVNKIGRLESRKDKSVDWWVEWFVKRVEVPADIPGAVAKRQRIAKGLQLV